MKKVLFLSAAVLALLGTSCSQDDVTPASSSNTTFQVSLPAEMGTRFGEGTTAKKLFVAIYKTDTNTPIFSNFAGDDPEMTVSQFATDPTTNRPTATVDVNLAKGETYDIICWAQRYTETSGEDAVYVYDPANKTIKVNYNNYQNFTEERDAFYGQKIGYTSTGAGQNITLTRPFAQINVGTSDLTAYQRAGGSATKFGMTIKGVSDVLDLTDGSVSESSADILTTVYTINPAAPILKNDATAAQTFPVTKENYDYLDMAYVLVGSEGSENANLTVQLTGDPALNDYAAWNEVPAMMNYRTNIYGTLLTNPEKFVIDLNADFGEPDLEVPLIWTGETEKPAPPVIDPETNKPLMTIENPEQLAYLASGQMTSADFPRGMTIEVTSSMDMSGYDWDPIYFPANMDTGASLTFDFGGNIIYGLSAPLFGSGNASKSCGYIKDLTIIGADITVNDAHNCGILADSHQGTLENIKIIDSKITLTKDDEEINVGGLIGFYGGGNATNCSIDGLTIDVTSTYTGTSPDLNVGGFYGTCNDNNGSDINLQRYFTGCSINGLTIKCSDNVNHIGYFFGRILIQANIQNCTFSNITPSNLPVCGYIWTGANIIEN